MLHGKTTPGITVVLALAMVTACSDAGPTAPPEVVQAFARPPGAGGGNGGGGGDNGGSSATTASLDGGMSAVAQAVSVSESGGTIIAGAASFTLDVNLGSTYSTDPGACLKEPADMPANVLEILVSRLEAVHLEDFRVEIDRQAALDEVQSTDNLIQLRGDFWLNVGLNNDRIGAGFPTVRYEGDASTIDDGTIIRTFTFLTVSGDVRVAERYDGNGDGKIKPNEPVAHLTCPLANGTAIGVTLAPAS